MQRLYATFPQNTVLGLFAVLMYSAMQPALAQLPRKGGAVDAKGLRHNASEFHGELPWIKDKVDWSFFPYPLSARISHHYGSGLFAAILDLKTGAVTRVAVIESTGYAELDAAASASLRRWRWRPGKWKEVDIPVTYELTLTPKHPPTGSTGIPIVSEASPPY